MKLPQNADLGTETRLPLWAKNPIFNSLNARRGREPERAVLDSECRLTMKVPWHAQRGADEVQARASGRCYSHVFQDRPRPPGGLGRGVGIPGPQVVDTSTSRPIAHGNTITSCQAARESQKVRGQPGPAQPGIPWPVPRPCSPHMFRRALQSGGGLTRVNETIQPGRGAVRAQHTPSVEQPYCARNA